jgi:hypothetical protein
MLAGTIAVMPISASAEDNTSSELQTTSDEAAPGVKKMTEQDYIELFKKSGYDVTKVVEVGDLLYAVDDKEPEQKEKDIYIQDIKIHLNSYASPDKLGLFYVNGETIKRVDVEGYSPLNSIGFLDDIRKAEQDGVKFNFTAEYKFGEKAEECMRLINEKYPDRYHEYGIYMSSYYDIDDFSLCEASALEKTELIYHIRIGDYYICCPEQSYPYDLGYYIVRDGKCYTLEEAYDQKVIDDEDLDKIVGKMRCWGTFKLSSVEKEFLETREDSSREKYYYNGNVLSDLGEADGYNIFFSNITEGEGIESYGTYEIKRGNYSAKHPLGVYLYKNGKFTTIEQAWKDGIVNNKNIDKIAELLKNSNFDFKIKDYTPTEPTTAEPTESSSETLPKPSDPVPTETEPNPTEPSETATELISVDPMPPFEAVGKVGEYIFGYYDAECYELNQTCEIGAYTFFVDGSFYQYCGITDGKKFTPLVIAYEKGLINDEQLDKTVELMNLRIKEKGYFNTAGWTVMPTEPVTTEPTTAEPTTEAVEPTNAGEQTNYLYITGSAGLCGKEWSESEDLDSRMTVSNPNAEPGTAEEGRLEKTFKNISAGTYEFKIYVINTRGKKFWINKGKTYTVEVEKDNSDVKIEYQSSVIEDDDEVKVTVIPPSAEPTTAEPTTEPQETGKTIKYEDKKVVKPAVKVKAANPIKVTAKAKTVKAKKLAKKAQKIKAVIVKNAVGKVTYKLTSVPKKIKKLVKINKKGVITLAKGKYAKKTYKIKVQITAAGNTEYTSAKKTVTVKVKVK